MSQQARQKRYSRYKYLDSPKSAAMYKFVAGIIRKSGYKRVLDVGCRHGRYAKYLDSSFEYYGFDVVPEAIEEAERRNPGRRFVVASWNNPPSVKVDIIIFGGILLYHKNKVLFLYKYIKKYNPKLIIIQDVSNLDNIKRRFKCKETKMRLDIPFPNRTILEIDV